MGEPDRAEGTIVVPALEAVRARVDPVLVAFLEERRSELAALDPAAVVLADELLRLVRAGGKRIRPAFCLWGYRAAGGLDGEPILRAAAALELLHTLAIVHDDVMDRTTERRGTDSTPARFAAEAPPGADPTGFGDAAAILTGDLAHAFAERLLRTGGFDAEPFAKAMIRFDRMRLEMAAGQLLDVQGMGREPTKASRVAALKTSSYTAEGPLLVGSALANAGPAAEGVLRVFGRLVGEAFQLRDDVLDGEAVGGASARVNDLVARAERTLDGAPLEPAGAAALGQIAGLLRMHEED